MAGKRTAGSELNQDNWAEEEESEEAGTFKKASVDALKGRIIRSARRRNVGNTGEEGTKGIFSGFTGFGKQGGDTASSKIFGGISFGSLGNGQSSSTTSSELNVDNSTSVSQATSDKSSSFSSKRMQEYNSQLKGLNEAVAKWIKSHVDATPICILTPIFRDYEKHLKEIEEKRSRTDDKPTDAVTKPESTSVTKNTNTNTFSLPENNDNLKSTFSFTSVATSKPINESKTIEPFKATPIFGNSSATFTFGQSTTSPPSGVPATGFSFGKGAPFSFGNVSAPCVAEEKKTEAIVDDECDEPPKVDFKPVIEEDSVYTVRCKVFIKKEAVYADGGVGNLFLKPVKDLDKTQLIVRADTSLGNLLVNILLSESLPAQRMGKNNVMMVCVYLPEKGPTPTSILLRVKTPEEADNLLEMINKYKK